MVVDSLRSHGSGALAERAVMPVLRGVELFGFHLCALDLRQNADVHEPVVADLLRAADLAADYAALARTSGWPCCASVLADPRRLRVPGAHVRRADRSPSWPSSTRPPTASGASASPPCSR